MSFWRNCEHLMVEFDINQKGLAEIAGTTPAAVNQWKKGVIPRAKTIERICREFNVTYDELINGSIPDDYPDDLMRLQRAYSRLCEDGRLALVTVAESLLKVFAEEAV